MIQTSKSGLKYFAEYKSGRLEHKMDHLGCFSGEFCPFDMFCMYITYNLFLFLQHFVL